MNKISAKDIGDYKWPEGTIMVYVGGPWCGPCRALDKPITELLEKYPSDRFLKVSIDEKVDAYYLEGTPINVSSIPVLCIIENGKHIKRTGASLDTIRSFITEESNVGTTSAFEVIDLFGKRKSKGTFDDFYNTELYDSLDEAYNANDFVLCNFVKSEGTLYIECHHTKTPGTKERIMLNFQNCPAGLDVSDDTAGVNLAIKMLENATT